MVQSVMTQYFNNVIHHLERLHNEEEEKVKKAALVMADHIKKDKIIYVYGPGGHSNLASQEIFFRAGGLMHVSAILDEGTLISSGALRSTAMERTPGYAKIVLDDYGLKEGDLLIIVNAYGINSAAIDSALEAKERGVFTIGVSSVEHAGLTPKDHVARHPTKQNLHDVVDISIDSKIQVGDASVDIEGVEQKVGAMSTFANAYLLNSLAIETIDLLAKEGIEAPIWTSGNKSGGDAANARFIEQFKGRIKKI